MGRGDLSDEEWGLIGPLLPSEPGRWARPAGDNRRFLNGMLHVLRVGCPWRDMHERYGKRNSVYVRFRENLLLLRGSCSSSHHDRTGRSRSIRTIGTLRNATGSSACSAS
jgi:transposase